MSGGWEVEGKGKERESAVFLVCMHSRIRKSINGSREESDGVVVFHPFLWLLLSSHPQ